MRRPRERPGRPQIGSLALGLEPGDEVIVPAHTFAATFEAVTQAGGRPVLVDVRNDDYNLDAAAVEASLSDRTKFVLPVHLYGQLADMASLQTVADKAGLRILEDACQAHGATRDAVQAGKAGACAAFSFYPGKNLGAFGDAGALTTDDEEARCSRSRPQRTWAATEVPPRLRGLHGAAGHDPGHCAVAQAPAA